MKVQKISVLTDEVKEKVFQLWNKEYPRQLAYADIWAFEEFLDGVDQKVHYTLLDENGQLIGWCGTFNRDLERWFSILVDSGYQGKGGGRLLMNEVMKKETELNGWVVDHHDDIRLDGGAYRSPLQFYMKLGFLVLEEERFEKKGLSAVKVCWRQE